MRAELYWIVDVPQGRRLAIMPRPRGGDWLSDELSSWKSSRVDVVVSLLAVDEVADLGLSQEAALCEALEMIFVSFPIVDRGVPSSGEAFLGLVERLHGYLQRPRGRHPLPHGHRTVFAGRRLTSGKVGPCDQ